MRFQPTMQYQPPSHAGGAPRDPPALTASLTLGALPLLTALLRRGSPETPVVTR